MHTPNFNKTNVPLRGPKFTQGSPPFSKTLRNFPNIRGTGKPPFPRENLGVLSSSVSQIPVPCVTCPPISWQKKPRVFLTQGIKPPFSTRKFAPKEVLPGRALTNVGPFGKNPGFVLPPGKKGEEERIDHQLPGRQNKGLTNPNLCPRPVTRPVLRLRFTPPFGNLVRLMGREKIGPEENFFGVFEKLFPAKNYRGAQIVRVRPRFSNDCGSPLIRGFVFSRSPVQK